MPEPSKETNFPVPDADIAISKEHMKNVMDIQAALRKEIAQFPQGYADTNVAKLAEMKYEDYNDLVWTVNQQEERRPGLEKFWEAANPLSKTNRAKREVRRWDHMINEANEQVTTKSGFKPIASEIANVNPDVTSQYL